MARKMTWRRFSLRAMLIALTLFALAFAIFARPIATYRAEVATAGWIEDDLGGKVKWEASAKPNGLEIFFERIGLEFVFRRVSYVELTRSGTKIDGAALKRIVQLKKIIHLELDAAAEIYDVDLPLLTQLKDLKYLSFQNARITTHGANQVIKLPKLEWVKFPPWFSGCITDPTEVDMWVINSASKTPVPVTGLESIDEAQEKIAILKKALQLATFPAPNPKIRPEDRMADSLEQLNGRLLDLGVKR